MMDGSQIVLINEYDPTIGFYKRWGVENDIRSSAQKNPNTYQLAIFACCREIFSLKRHSGHFATKKEAKIHSEEQRIAKQTLQFEEAGKKREQALVIEHENLKKKMEQIEKVEEKRMKTIGKQNINII